MTPRPKPAFFRLSLLLSVAVLVGCGEAPAGAPAAGEPEANPQAAPAARVASRTPAASEQRWTRSSDDGRFEITLSVQQGAAPIGPLHNWIVEVREADGTAVTTADISIGGGMPGHGHGLPTQPQVTRHLGDGQYLIEGMQFNMAGDWVLAVAVRAGEGGPAARARFEFTLDY